MLLEKIVAHQRLRSGVHPGYSKIGRRGKEVGKKKRTK
jgi:hypothetical protein